MVNLFDPPPRSALAKAIPVTLHGLETARAAAESRGITVDVVSSQYAEDRHVVPGWITPTEDLTRSVRDLKIALPVRLPLIGEILERLFARSDSTDLLVFTNVDISPVPGFYGIVARLAEQHDAFAINRRTITAEYQALDEFDLMLAQAGEPHPGHDCFVMRPHLVDRIELTDSIVGVDLVMRPLLLSLICVAERFEEFAGLHVTFHLGDDQVWSDGTFAPARAHNHREVRAAVTRLERKFGPLAEHPYAGRFLLEQQPPLGRARSWIRGHLKGVLRS